MKLMNKILIGSLLGIACLSGYALAQYSIPQVTLVGPNDLFQDIVGGYPQAQSFYAPAKLISGIEGYSLTVPTTGFSITVPNGTKREMINPAGTLATGTFTMMANPGDGQVTCFISSQTQTAVTISANTGQTISTTFVGALTAMTADTNYCYIYSASASAWYRTS